MSEYDDKMSELNDVAVEAINDMVSIHRAEVGRLSAMDLHGVQGLKQQATHRLQNIERWASEASHEIRLPSVDGGGFPIQ